MKQILIIQNFNANKGDSSVIYSMLSALKKIAGNDVNIRVTSYDTAKAQDEYGIDTAEWLLSFRQLRLTKGILRKLFYALREAVWFAYSFLWLILYSIGIKLYIPDFKKKTVRFYLESDVVVLPGGHFFTNFNGFATNISHWLAIFFGVLLKKKTMIYAQTIGPFLGFFGFFTKHLTYHILSKVDLVTVRDKSSLQYCTHMSNVHLTAESAFGLDINSSIANRIADLNYLRNTAKLLVGVTVHHRYYRFFYSRDVYIQKMASIFDEIINVSNAHILIIPMEDAIHSGGDRPIAKEIIATTQHAERIHILDGDYSPPITAAVIANMDIFIGTKTHSIVYGLKSSVPTIAIAYQQKSREFMELFDMGEYVVDLKHLKKDDFMKIYSNVIIHRTLIADTLKHNIGTITQKSLINAELLIRLAG